MSPFEETQGDKPAVAADPRDFVADLPRELCLAVLKCLARNPLGRFANATELRTALEAGASGPTPNKPLARLVRNSAMFVVVPGLIALVGLLAFGPDPGGHTERSNPTGHAEGRVSYKPWYTKSRAVVIGITDYPAHASLGRLHNAELDAKAVATELVAMGWEVEPVLGKDATKRRIQDELADVENASGPDDQLLVYYAGHGSKHAQNNQTGWIIPFDGQPVSEDRNHNSWIPFDHLAMTFRCEAKHILLVLDCCCGGRLARITRGETPSTTRPTTRRDCEPYLTRKAHLVLASTDGDRPVDDGDEGHNSPFAAAFLEALRRRDVEVLTASELFAHIQRSVRSKPSGPAAVRPVLRPVTVEDSGDFVFLLPKHK
jgi:hypothetical protein